MSIKTTSGCSRFTRSSASSPDTAMPMVSYPKLVSFHSRSSATMISSSTIKTLCFIFSGLGHISKLLQRKFDGEHGPGAGSHLELSMELTDEHCDQTEPHGSRSREVEA